jgi:hypothetical protein
MDEKTREMTIDEKAEKESLKLLFEVYKHLTTLSSGSIIIICTFLEKFFKTPKSLHLITGSLICFLVSIIGSVYVMPHLAMEQNVNQSDRKAGNKLLRRLEFISSLSFVLGVILLAVFSMINFYK